MTVPAAFYAPLKSPDHPSPSGDRTMARLLLAALGEAGFAPATASRLRTHEPTGDPARQEALRQAGVAEAARLVATFAATPEAARPRLWFTYHCYYKAPDWIGPAVSRALGIPYCVAEGSRAAKRAGGPWALGHAGAEAALDAADTLFAMTGHDREALARGLRAGQRLLDLPPFLDAAAWPEIPAPEPRSPGPVRLLAVAMMRPGDKLASFRILAEALSCLPAGTPAWTLDLVGDGPARPDVRQLFAPFAAAVTWHGLVPDRDRLAVLYATSDLLVWPAVNEAYGMALLEAQVMGCPVLAGRSGGVADAVRDGETGILVAPGDPSAFAEALGRCLRDPGELRRLGTRARSFVRRDRNLGGAATILREGARALAGQRLGA
ncbi:glycosyltransferase family 4 protein [Enterovirga sp.]|uniref:glycosyltransferase family 4 protein n=1 Tax=Enterovirga sp. TaxID=2026350 RepID=UPI00262FB307|nr:glycosyltransferase family 4 protein [Enterovirga sp.]MDB5591784.1 glycosyl transferase group 1 [Enterovirga sp.]